MDPVLERLLTRYPDLDHCLPDIEAAYRVLEDCYAGGGKLLVCGNGGSAADAEHLVGELMKGFLSRRPVPDDLRERLISADPEGGAYVADRLQGALPAIALSSHPALSTAIANDIAGDLIFAQQVYGYGRPGDVLLAVSTSGNAENVVHALRVARAVGVRTVGLTGRTGGRMRNLCDVAVCVPWDSTPDVQERHLPVYHALAILLEQRFFP